MEILWVFKCSKSASSDILPPTNARLLNLPKLRHRLGPSCSNMGAYKGWGLFSFKPTVTLPPFVIGLVSKWEGADNSGMATDESQASGMTIYGRPEAREEYLAFFSRRKGILLKGPASLKPWKNLNLGLFVTEAEELTLYSCKMISFRISFGSITAHTASCCYSHSV